MSGLLTDIEGRILIVKPSYRDGWLLPGGVVEPGESPATALAREFLEEVSMQVTVGGLRCTDYMPPNGPYEESIHLMFDCVVSDIAVSTDPIPDGVEITSAEFSATNDALRKLVPTIAKRIIQVGSLHGCYLENGKPLPSQAKKL